MIYDAWKTTEPLDEHRMVGGPVFHNRSWADDQMPLCTSCGQREMDCECLYGWSYADEVEARREHAERCVARNLQRLASSVRPIHPRDAIKRGWLEAAAWAEAAGIGYAPEIVAANLRQRALDVYLVTVPGYCDTCGRPATSAVGDICARHFNAEARGEDGL